MNKLNIFIQFLFFAWLKLTGLLPFSFCKKFVHAQKSNFFQFYNLFFGLCLSSMMVYSAILIEQILLKRLSGEFIILIVANTFEWMSCTLRTIVIYFYQYFYRNKLIFLINKLKYIWTWLLETNANIKFVDEFFIDQLMFRLYVLVLQIGFYILAVIVYTGEFDVRFEMSAFFLSVYVYGHIVSFLAGTFYYFCMLIAFQFFRTLNECLLMLTHEIHNKMLVIGITGIGSNFRQFYMLSDRIDKISLLYREILKFYQQTYQCFQFQILLSMFASFLLITSNVSICLLWN